MLFENKSVVPFRNVQSGDRMMAGREISNYLQGNLLHCHSVHCNFHMDVLRLKPVSSSESPADKYQRYG
jgi:hypothetical protein